jgi:hypothetical protein
MRELVVNTEDLRALAERAETVTGREGNRLAEVHGRIGTARRRRGLATAAGSAAVVLALVVGGALLVETRERADAPINHPTPTPSTSTSTSTEAIIPAGQVTVFPNIRPGDVRGWKTLATRTNTQPGRQGATELSMTIAEYFGDGLDGSYVDLFCHASSDTWWAYSYGNGGAGYGQCSMDDPVSPPPPDRDLGPSTFPFAPEPLPVRMFVFAPSKAETRCLRRTGSLADCRIAPAASTGATFGFAVHEHRANRIVLRLGKNVGVERLHLEDPLDFEALVIKDGHEYITEKAVVAAAGAHRLVVRLDASDRDRLVGVFSVRSHREEVCRNGYSAAHRIPGSGQSAERALNDDAAAFCAVEHSLRADDGQVVVSTGEPGPGDPWMHVPGGTRTVAVEVTRGDPDNESLALVVWRARP